jgi:hypothetical protein
MPALRRALTAGALLLALAAPTAVGADGVAPLSPVGLLRPEWTVERTRTGRARVVGYLYNDNGERNAANVLLRVEQVTDTGAVAGVYLSRILGDVLSRGRMSFDVPVADAEGKYRVLVESVDWLMECR